MASRSPPPSAPEDRVRAAGGCLRLSPARGPAAPPTTTTGSQPPAATALTARFSQEVPSESRTSALGRPIRRPSPAARRTPTGGVLARWPPSRAPSMSAPNHAGPRAGPSERVARSTTFAFRGWLRVNRPQMRRHPEFDAAPAGDGFWLPTVRADALDLGLGTESSGCSATKTSLPRPQGNPGTAQTFVIEAREPGVRRAAPARRPRAPLAWRSGLRPGTTPLRRRPTEPDGCASRR